MNLDSIDIRLSVSADKAAKSLEGLKTSLAGLSAALAPASSGLESMVVSLGKLVGMQSGLSSISKTFSTLANSWTALNASTNKSAAEMAGISDKARTMSQSFAKEYGIKSKGSVQELTNAFHKLYSSVGDTVAMGQALGQIDHLIRSFAQLKGESTEAGIAIREALQATTVKLPEDLRRDLGANLIKQMGKLSHVSKTEGALPSEIVKEINRSLDPNALLGGDKDYSAGFIDITGIDNEAQILEKLVAALTAAEGKTMTFYEAAKQDGGVITHLDEQLNAVATSLGTTLTGSIESYLSAAQRINEISPELARQFMQFDTAIDNIAQNGNPFEAVLGGLTQLQDIHLSDSLNNITAIKDAISKFGGDYAGRAAANLPGIASALKQFDGFTVPPIGEDLMNLAAGMSKLGGKKIADAYEPLTKILSALTAFNGLAINQEVIKSVAMLGDALYKFGLAKMDKAVENIPKMAQSISQLVNQLSTMPAVSENTIRLVSALGNVNVTGNMAANTMGGRLSNGLKKFSGNAFNARKASMSLANAFGRMYANFFIFFRLARRFVKDIDLASQLTEVQNVVDVTFGDMSDKMNDFAKTAVDTLGMSELTAKQIGSKYQAMGTAIGISKSMAQSTNDFVQKATNGYADVANSMADISINLTRLAGDMASFYNQDYADVAEKLQAIFTGQTKPLRAFGIDLTNATIQQWALNRGMEVNIKTMTQAEKTLLRYQYVMAQTAAAHGDFERTQTTWANSVRIATERLNQLRIVLGKIAIYTFKPLVQSFNRAMEQIVKGAEGLLNALGKIFGWQIEWSDGGIINEEADDADDLAENMGDAADNAKKFKNFLLGIDELNLLPDNSDKDKGGKDGLGGLGSLGDAMGGFNIKPVEKGFDSIYDTLFKLGRRINEILKDLLQSIDWDKVYEKARKFGKGFAQFLNGLLLESETFYEIGRFFANGVNTFAHGLDAFHKEFDGFKLGVDIGSVINGFIENLDWKVIQSAAVEKAHDLAQTINGAFLTINWKELGKTIAEGLNTAIDYFYTLGKEINWSTIGMSIAEGINGFFANFDFVQAAETLNLWAKGLLNALIAALDKTDWKKVGESIGEFIQRIDFISIGTKVVRAIWEALDGAFSVYRGVFEAAPIEMAITTALTTALTSKTLTKNILKALRKQGKKLSVDVENLFNGNTLKTFMSGFIGADDRGIVTEAGTVLGNLKNGVNAVSESLSKATKVVGGLAVGFGEFFAIKDSIYDIVSGTDEVVKSIESIVGAASLAGIAMTALLGFPTGLIATLAVGAAAGITGLIKGVIDNDIKAFNESVINALSVPDGADLYTYMGNLKAQVADAAGNFTELDKKSQTIIDLKEGISKNMDEIETSIGKIDLSLQAQIDLLPEDIQNVVDQFKGLNDDLRKVLSESYDIIATALTGWGEAFDENFAITKPEILAVVHDINESMGKDIDEIESQMAELKAQLDAGDITTTEFYESFTPLLEKQNEIKASMGLIEDSASSLEETINGIDLSTLYSVDADGVLKLSEQFVAADEAIRVAYDDTVKTIEDGGNAAIKELKAYLANAQTLEQRETLLKAITIEETYMNMEKEKTLGYVESFYDEVQKGILSGYDSVIESAKNEYNTNPFSWIKYTEESDAVNTYVQKYQREQIEPLAEHMRTMWGDAIDESSIYVGEKSQEIYDALFYTPEGFRVKLLNDDYKNILESQLSKLPDIAAKYGEDTSKAYQDGVNKANTQSKVFNDLSKATGVLTQHDRQLDGSIKKWDTLGTKTKNWATIFENVGRNIIPSADKVGKDAGEGYKNGVSKATDDLVGGLDKAKEAGKEAGSMLNDFTNYAKGLNEPTKQSTASLKEMNSVMKDIASGGGGKKMNDTFQAMIGFQSQAGLAVNGVTNVKDALEKTVTAGNGVKDISTNFGTLITNLSGFANAFMPIKTGFDMFATDTQTNMTKTSAIFGESFTNIIKYGNQTIAWMKGSFIPMFSGAYWNSITSSIPTAFGNAFKQATNIMVNLWKQFAQWANQNMKMKVNMRGKEVTGVEVNIPQYDTGGFPEDGMFMANHNEMVGQFANGKTAVANNEQIVEGIRQGVYDAVTAAMANGGQGVTVELVGDASDIFTAVVKENNRSIMRTGASPIRV